MIGGDLMLQGFMSLCAGAGAYAAIRADLARLHERATQAQQAAEKAHERIDGILNRH